MSWATVSMGMFDHCVVLEQHAKETHLRHFADEKNGGPGMLAPSSLQSHGL